MSSLRFDMTDPGFIKCPGQEIPEGPGCVDGFAATGQTGEELTKLDCKDIAPLGLVDSDALALVGIPPK